VAAKIGIWKKTQTCFNAAIQVQAQLGHKLNQKWKNPVERMRKKILYSQTKGNSTKCNTCDGTLWMRKSTLLTAIITD